MKKTFALAFVVVFIFLILASGCLNSPEEAGNQITGEMTEVPDAEETEVKQDCNDDNACTADIFNTLTEECEHKIKKDCCGNYICEGEERCNEDTHQTECVEDCGRTCQAYLIIEESDDIFAMSCGGSNCVQTDVNKFTMSGDSKVKAKITNIGESASSRVYSNFICWSGESQAISDKKEVKGIVFTDYFEDEEDNIDHLDAVQSGSNSVNYYLAVDIEDDAEFPLTVNCKSFIRSTSFSNEQEFILNFI